MTISNFHKKYLESMTEGACEIIKKLGHGESITAAEYSFLCMYQRELSRCERVPFSEQLMNGAGKMLKFARNNFGELLNSITEDNMSLTDGYIPNYPVTNCAGVQITAGQIKTLRHYTVRVITTPTSGSFQILGCLGCSPITNAQSLPVAAQ